MIVVTVPTGKIGSKVNPHLPAANAALRVIARVPSKPSEMRGKVEIVTGSLNDEAMLEKALKGAQSPATTRERRARVRRVAHSVIREALRCVGADRSSPSRSAFSSVSASRLRVRLPFTVSHSASMPVRSARVSSERRSVSG